VWLSCTLARVKEPNIDDYKKLVRTMKYLRGTRSLATTDTSGGWYKVNKVVGQWSICCPPRHEEPYWWYDTLGKRLGILYIDSTEAEYPELD
jgi:hypothetical protein